MTPPSPKAYLKNLEKCLNPPVYPILCTFFHLNRLFRIEQGEDDAHCQVSRDLQHRERNPRGPGRQLAGEIVHAAHTKELYPDHW